MTVGKLVSMLQEYDQSYIVTHWDINIEEELTEEETVRPELEGGGNSWWYVCGECHTMIDSRDRFCRQCGRGLEWGEQ